MRSPETVMPLIAALTIALLCTLGVHGLTLHKDVFRLTNRYSAMPGSSKSTNGRGVTHEHMELLKAHDRGHMIKLRSGVVSLPVAGAADPYVAGLYFTRVQIGTPPKSYNLQVDTGSDVLWVNCNPCVGCPSFSDLKIPIVPYDVQSSSSSTKISCTDPICSLVTEISESGCNEQGLCGYSFVYGDGSSTVGYLVEDVLHYTVNATATVIFGCGFKQSGDLASSERALDGIIGFGSSELSIPSQLAKQGKAPNVFAHCLEGGDRGGGILVLGKVLEPDIQYTPLVPFMSHYNVLLQNISVNGVNLTVDQRLFSSDDMHGTIFDSGTTLAYLPDQVYRSFVNAVVQAAAVPPVAVSGNICFMVPGSVYKSFPDVTLYFDGASMHLTPTEYLIRQASADNAPIWCMGWQSTGSTETQIQFTIFGDLVLKNKLVVYDLDAGRIGWRPYDCSTTVDVSAESGIRTVGADHAVLSMGRSNRTPGLLSSVIVLVIVSMIMP